METLIDTFIFAQELLHLSQRVFVFTIREQIRPEVESLFAAD